MTRTLFVVALALGLSASEALATAIAQIKAAEGSVEVLRNGRWRKAREGTELTIKDSIRTGEDSLAQLEFYDGDAESGATPTTVDLVPESEISIEHFEISKRLPRQRQGFIDLAKGYLRAFTKGWATGSIFSVKAGTTVCGIRGSTVDISFDPATGQASFTSLDGQMFTFNLPQNMDPVEGNALAVSMALNMASNLAAGLPVTTGLAELANAAKDAGRITPAEAGAVIAVANANPSSVLGVRPMTPGERIAFNEREGTQITTLTSEQTAMLLVASAQKAHLAGTRTDRGAGLQDEGFEEDEESAQRALDLMRTGDDDDQEGTGFTGIDAILSAITQELVGSPELNGPASSQ